MKTILILILAALAFSATAADPKIGGTPVVPRAEYTTFAQYMSNRTAAAEATNAAHRANITSVSNFANSATTALSNNAATDRAFTASATTALSNNAATDRAFVNSSTTALSNQVSGLSAGSQTPWTSDINAAGYSLTNLGAVIGAPSSPTNPAVFSWPGTNANGKLFSIQAGSIASNITLLPPTNGFAGITAPVLGVTNIVGDANGTTGRLYWIELSALGSGAAQTPWAQDINAAQYKLTNAAQISVQGTAAGRMELVNTNGATNYIARADGAVYSAFGVQFAGGTVTNILRGSATVDFGNCSAGSSVTVTVTATGAKAGSIVALAWPLNMTSGPITAAVTSDDNLTFTYFNTTTGGAVDLASQTVRYTIIQ